MIIRTMLPHITRTLFNAFGSNLAKDVTSDARKTSAPVASRSRKCSETGECSSTTVNRETYKRRKLTSSYKS